VTRIEPVYANYDPWWGYDDNGEEAESASALMSEYRRINELETYRILANRAFIRWYGDPRYNGYSTLGSESTSPNIFNDEDADENVIREILCTNYNKFKKNRPQPAVITSGGEYTDWEEAEDKERWLRGCFAKDKVYSKLDQAQFNSMVVGDGFLGVRDDWDIGRPVGYLIPSTEIHVDAVEAYSGEIRTIYRVGSLPKEFLASRFPEYEDEIWKATPFLEELWKHHLWQAHARQINYIEAWHLPSRKNANDGRHIFALPTLTLANEDWEEDYFPIVRLPCNPRPDGFYSAGLIEDLIGIQRQRNKVGRAIDEHLKLLSSSFWALKRGSNIVKAAISNLIGRAIDYTGDKPELMTPSPVSPNLFEREQQLRERAFASARTNSMAVQSMKPAGLNSGKALRVYADQEDAGNVGMHMAREDAVVELAWLYARRAQYMLENQNEDEHREANLSIRVVHGGRLHELTWGDSNLEEMEIQVLPASSLSTTLAGKLEDIADLADQGVITDPDQKRQLLQMPDLQADNDLSLAPRNIILYTLQHRILREGEAVTPEPFWDLHAATDLGLKVLAQAQLRGYPESKISLLRNWVTECITRNAVQPAPAPPTAPQGLPGQSGPPMPAGPQADAPIPAGPQAGPPAPVGPIPGGQ
jgi:hypothetical protein